MLTIALSKGRILDQTIPLLKKVGISIATSELESRKLILDTNFNEIKVNDMVNIEIDMISRYLERLITNNE